MTRARQVKGVSAGLVSDSVWLGVAGHLNAAAEFEQQEFLAKGNGTVTLKAPGTSGHYQIRFFKANGATEANLAARIDFIVKGIQATADALVGTWEYDEVWWNLTGMEYAEYLREQASGMPVNSEAVMSNEEWVEIQIENDRLEYKYLSHGKLTIERGDADGRYLVTVSAYRDDFPNTRVVYVWDAVWDESTSQLKAETNHLVYEEDTRTGGRTYGYEGNEGRAVSVSVTVSGGGNGNNVLSFEGELIDTGKTQAKYRGMQTGTVSGTKISDTVESLN